MLTEHRKILETFVEKAPSSMAMFDTAMCYLSASRGWLTDYNLGNRDLRGLSHYDVFPEMTAELREVHRRALAGEVLNSEGDCFKRADGSEQWVRWEIRPWHNNVGQIGGIVIFSEDITDRKRIEKELKASELRAVEEKERLSCLLNSMSDEVWFADIHGQFTLANPSAAREFNLPSSDGIDVVKLAESLEVFRPDGSQRPVGEAPPLRALAGEVIRGEEEIILTPSTGALRYRQVSSSPVFDADGHIMGSISVVRDITERKQAEDARRESEIRHCEQETLRTSKALFYEVLEHSQVASYKRNLQTESYEYLSSVFAQLAGYTPDELMRLPMETVLNCIHPDDLPEVKQVLADVMVDVIKKPYYLEYRFKHRDGQYRWFQDRFIVVPDAAGQALARIGSINDITEKKWAEEALQEQRWRLSNIIAGAHVGTWEWNVQTGSVVVNERWAQMIGYSLADLPAVTIKTWEMLAHPEDLRQSSLLLDRHFSGELPYYDFECRMKHRDGHWIWVSDRGCVITRTKDGKPLMMLGTHLDITGRKLAEEELLKAHGELERKVLERTAELEKTNATLAMMLDYARKTEMDIQERVVANLRSNILGIADMLKKEPLTENAKTMVEHLESTTRNLAHPLARNLESQLLKLTAREIQLANFIRLGKSTKELMVLLAISEKTVENYRNSLRRKLGINRKKISLRTFLNAEFMT